MEWNTKHSVHWDWDSLIMFNAASNGSPKKLQPTVWDFDVEGGIKSGSIYSSGGGDGGGVSGSDLGLASLSKTSKSESTDSPLTVEVKTSKITLEANQATPEECTTTKELAQAKPTGTSPVLEASVGSGEPFLSLKLGKRTYFEDGCARSNTKTSSLSLIPVSSVSTEKKMKSLFQNTQVPCCQVEGCNLELTSAKDYHRKHRVCETHSKFPKVIVNGLERRFCQQCSRFHSLPEFDEKKRSCRRRLTDHNARRRKPQPESFRLNAARLPSSLYGIEEPRTPSNVDATQEHHRALSLLSSDSRISCQPKSSSFKLPMHTHHANMPQTAVHAIPQGRPLPSSDCWRGEQRSSSSRGHSLASANDGSNFTPGFQLYGNGFYANRLN